jgi:hypothetical protein
MIRQPKNEHQQRMAHKRLEQMALQQLQDDFECSPFESRAILEVMSEIFELAWQGPERLKPGQMCVLAVAADEPAGKPLAACRMKPIILTLHSVEDEALRQKIDGRQVIPQLRRAKLQRLAAEALAQDTCLTVEDLANTCPGYPIIRANLRRELAMIHAMGTQKFTALRSVNGHVKPTQAMVQERIVASFISRQPALSPSNGARPSEPGDRHSGRCPAQPR